MEWSESLELIATRTSHDRYRWLCSDANPDAESREAYRRLVVRLAAAESDVDRAARLIAEGPPEHVTGLPSGRRCCG